MNARARQTLSVFVLAAAALLSGCARTAPHHWLRIADGSGDLTSLNPHLSMGASLDDLSQLTMAYFVRYGPGEREIPELITEIPTKHNGGISRDGRTIVWHLRRGVRWSDGAPFDARDVVFTTRAILNRANDEVQGTEGWDQIAGIAAPDRYTVVYRLKRPYGALVALAFRPVGAGPCLLPAHLLAGLANINTAPYNALPVGIGPFRFVRWKRGDAVELEANPFYWRGRPKLARITYEILPSRETLFAQMQTGDVDLWPRVPPTYARRLAALPHVRVVGGASLRTTHLDFMLTPGAIADASVRAAVRLALDRRRIRDAIERGGGLLTDAIVWPAAPVRRDDPHTIGADPEGARALLDADGWRPGRDGIRAKDGRRLALAMPYQAGSPDLDGCVELMRAELRTVGIELDARTYTHAILFAPKADGGIVENGRFDAVLYSSTITSLPDLGSNFDCEQVPPRGENYTHWCDPRVAPLLARMRASYDASEVAAAFARLNRLFVADVPSIQLFVWKGTYARSDRLTGYRDNLLTSFDTMLDADT
jgi:peptide/nickel transport system substrate-binding protein